MTLNIALIYPELLGTYGDRGNALVLNHRAKLRDIEAEIVTVSPGDTLPDSADVYLLGGGEDNAQTLATDLLADQQSKLENAIEKSLLIAVCAGFQILGKQFPVAGGKIYRGLEVIDASAQIGSPRIIGEVVTQCSIEGVGQLTGFENHGGRTSLGVNAKPLGKVSSGLGNGIETGQGFVDGYVSKNIIATYLHGPVFARNPVFADYVLAKAMNVSLESLAPIPDDPSVELHERRLATQHK